MANAVRFAGSELWIPVAKLATKTITGVTKANPAVVSVTTHGGANGDPVYIGAVTGMPEFPAGWYVMGAVAAGTFTINLDTTSYAAVGTGGSIQQYTMNKMCEAKNFNSTNPSRAEVDSTGMCDSVTTFEAGLGSLGTISISANQLPQGTVQKALRGYDASGETFPVKVNYPNPTVNGAYMVPCFVQNMNFSGAVNGIWGAEGSLKKAQAEYFFIPA
jgi:hypothetical protein